MRTTLVAGNWKTTASIADASPLLAGLVDGWAASVAAVTDHGSAGAVVEMLVCPPFPVLPAAGEALRGSGIRLGAQDAHWKVEGAFTGAVSPAMLRELGCRYCLCGHSERRRLFRETAAEVGAKVAAVSAQGMVPILCVGESIEERQAGAGETVVLDQLRAGLADCLSAGGSIELVVAYEPVWAIGSGTPATPEDAQSMHVALRRELAERLGAAAAAGTRILYGGSVNAKNAASFIGSDGPPDVDGVLVGGASLRAEEFLGIARSAIDAAL